MTRKRIGDFYVEKGILTRAQVGEAIDYGQRMGLRLDAAAMELKLIDRETLIRLFGSNNSVDFFYLDPNYLPQETKDLLSVPMMLSTGAILLGFKTKFRFFRTRKVLNVGLLNPNRQDSVEKIRQAICTGFPNKFKEKEIEVKVFLILADQYLDVMRQVYQVDADKIRATDPSQLDGTLAMYL